MKYGYQIFILFLVSCILFFGQGWFRLQHDAYKATKTAVPWLISHQREISDPGVIWILTKINRDYCGNDPRTAATIRTLFRPLAEDSTKAAYERLLDEQFTYTVATSSLEKMSGHFDGPNDRVGR